MSRLEKTIKSKYKRKKFRFMTKIVFLFIMIVNTSICIFIVDKNAKDMLGYKSLNIKSFVVDFKIKDKINEINNIALDIVKQFK